MQYQYLQQKHSPDFPTLSAPRTSILASDIARFKSFRFSNWNVEIKMQHETILSILLGIPPITDDHSNV